MYVLKWIKLYNGETKFFSLVGDEQWLGHRIFRFQLQAIISPIYIYIYIYLYVGRVAQSV